MCAGYMTQESVVGLDSWLVCRGGRGDVLERGSWGSGSRGRVCEWCLGRGSVPVLDSAGSMVGRQWYLASVGESILALWGLPGPWPCRCR